LKSIAAKWFFLQTHDSDFEARCHGLLVIFERAFCRSEAGQEGLTLVSWFDRQRLEANWRSLWL